MRSRDNHEAHLQEEDDIDAAVVVARREQKLWAGWARVTRALHACMHVTRACMRVTHA